MPSLTRTRIAGPRVCLARQGERDRHINAPTDGDLCASGACRHNPPGAIKRADGDIELAGT